MESVTLNVVYKHILQIGQMLDNLENVLEIPTVTVSAKELASYKKTLQSMIAGKEGISLSDYKKSQS